MPHGDGGAKVPFSFALLGIVPELPTAADGLGDPEGGAEPYRVGGRVGCQALDLRL